MAGTLPIYPSDVTIPSVTAPAPTPVGASPSPWLRRILLTNVVLEVGIVVTGGLVRLTGSGLGCPTWPELDPAIVNVNGGAIAIGHPLGCSGARVIGSLAHELHRRGGGWGLAAICIGVGQGLAVVLRA